MIDAAAAAERARSDAAVEAFHRLFYDTHDTTWKQTFWLGVTVRKCAFDLWTYQEILVDTRPDLIVETGTYLGGSAFYLAGICDLLGHGKIVTVDISAHLGGQGTGGSRISRGRRPTPASWFEWHAAPARRSA